MRADGDDFVLTPADLLATADALGMRPGPLSLLPRDLAGGSRVDDALSGDARERFVMLVRALADPAKSGRLHHAVADQAIGRVALAWHAGLGDGIATLTAAGALCRLGLSSAGGLRLLAAQVLALDSVNDEGLQRIALGTPAGLAWLAVLDQLRRARFVSLLSHTAPVEIFGPEDVTARFTASAEEDFRWPLNFVARLAPLPLHELDVARDPKTALEELVAARLIERVSDGGAPAFELSAAGASEADAILHDVSKIGLEVTQPSPRGIITDVALFIRSALRLHLFYLSAGESAFGGLSGIGADNLLGHLLAAPEPVVGNQKAESAPTSGALVQAPDAWTMPPSRDLPVAVTGTLVRPPLSGAVAPVIPAAPQSLRKTPTEPVTLPPAVLQPKAPTPSPVLESTDATLVPTSSAPVTPETEDIIQLRPLILILERVGAPPLMMNLEQDGTVGRSAENEIALDDTGASRRHAAIRRTADGAWEIEDLRSSNGTLVNDVRITGKALLATGDRIHISRSILRVERAPAPVRRR